jgi:hypothetical protein
MPCYICTTCGSQFSESAAQPSNCPICEDQRQYVPAGGQSWTTHESLKRRFTNTFRLHESNLMGIGTVPAFGIGQRALLIMSEHGNVLWDCTSLVDDATVEIVRRLGGVSAIAISHPHYYASMVEWSHAFNNAPIHLPAADRQWIMRHDATIRLFEGDTLAITPDVTLIRCGGHFAGGTVLHWSKGAQGRGCLLTGDVIMVTSDRKSVSFMRSYPNLIPLSAPSVRRIVTMTDAFSYESVYGPFFDRVIVAGGRDTVHRCATRYLAAIEGDGRAELQ